MNKRFLVVFVLLLQIILMERNPVSAQKNSSPAKSSPVLRCETTDGHIVCGAGAPCSQIPGHPDLFVGRGQGIGTLDYCHHVPPAVRPFLALFRMDWKNNKMVLVNYLLKLPDRPAQGITTPLGLYVAGAYDPYVAEYKGEIWVAFETLVPGSCSTCVAPLTKDMKKIDVSRLTLVAQGTSQKSASAPVLLNYQNHLYVYWQVDYWQNQLPQNRLITRGMELEENSSGRMWGKGSGGRPVTTDDTHLTSLVHDVNASDPTANHVAVVWYVGPVGDGKLLVISSLGGTAGKECCKSSHEDSTGCWRLSLSIADAPLGENVFGKKIIDLPSLPDEAVSYARVIVDPNGQKLLLTDWERITEFALHPDQPLFPAGSLVLKAGESKTTNRGKLAMESDGNLVFYNLKGKSGWSSGTAGKVTDKDCRACFQGDGNLVLYHGNKPYWSSGTDGHPKANLLLSAGPPYLFIFDKAHNSTIWPYRTPIWPNTAIARPDIPLGFRYISFDSVLTEVLHAH